MNVDKATYDNTEAHAHAAYDDGGHADDIVRLVFQRLDITVDDKPVAVLGHGYTNPYNGDDETV